MKILKIAILFLFIGFAAKSQSYLYYATQPESFLDSTCTKKIRKLSKGECVLVENLIPYKKKYLYGTCVRDGKAGFIEVAHLKQEKVYYPDSSGKHPIDIVKKEYALPFARLMNVSKHAIIRITFENKKYVLKPGENQELKVKPGKHRFKVETAGYQPLYTMDEFSAYHIKEVEFFIE